MKPETIETISWVAGLVISVLGVIQRRMSARTVRRAVSHAAACHPEDDERAAELAERIIGEAPKHKRPIRRRRAVAKALERQRASVAPPAEPGTLRPPPMPPAA